MKVLLALLPLMLSLPVLSTAQTTEFIPRAYKPSFQCPESHPEYTTLLNSFKELQGKLNDLECKELSLDVEKFTQLIGEKREGFLDIITSNKDGVLSAADAEQIQGYSSEVTEQAAVLISMFNNTDGWNFFGFTPGNECTLEKEDRFAGIQRVTSAAYEASKLLAYVAGPYGVPISIAAKTAMGVVQGLQTFMDQREPINFDTFEKRAFYAESLCLFSSLENEVKQLNNSESHLDSLLEVRNGPGGAVEAINKVRQFCPTCNDVLDFEMVNYDDEELMKEQIDEFREIIKDANESSFNGFRAGTKTLEFRQNLEWLDKEISKYRSVNDFPTSGIIPAELELVSKLLNDFLLDTASPIFMDWYVDESYYLLKDLSETAIETGATLSSDMRDMQLPVPYLNRGTYKNEFGIKEHISLDILHYDLMNKSIDKATYSPRFYSSLVKIIRRWKETELNLKIVTEYCDFFDQSTNVTRGIEGVCGSKNRSKYMSKLAYHAFFLADIVDNSKELSRRNVGPFDFSLDKYIEFLDQEKLSIFLDAESLLEKSKNGKSMNLVDGEDSDENKFLYTNWTDASRALIKDKVEIFTGSQNSGEGKLPFPTYDGPY